MDLFKRVIKVNVGSKTLEEPLTIHFDVPFDDAEEVNTSTVKVYNLSESTISGIRSDSPIFITAGYESGYGNIFLGVVKSPETAWSGVDKLTQIECVEENKDYLKAKINKAFAPGTSSREILLYLIGESNLGIGDLSPVENFVYRNGKTLKGDVSTLIKSIVKDTKSKMHISRGRIFIRDPQKGDAIGFIVDKDSGLVDVPERIETVEESKGNGEKNSRSGWKIKTLLNHQITVDTLIVVKSKTANGQFRVVKGRHYCDGNGFYTEVECY